MPNMKALALTVWDKTIFKNFLLYLYAGTTLRATRAITSPKNLALLPIRLEKRSSSRPVFSRVSMGLKS